MWNGTNPLEPLQGTWKPWLLARGEPGECWFVQPGREPAPYAFRGVPGPKSGTPPPTEVTWKDH